MILKQQPEDFIVTEEPNVTLESGPYSYIKVTKKNRTTLDIAKLLETKCKTKVGFAGTKDKHAITTQYFSLLKTAKEKIEHCNIDNTTIEWVGTGKEPLTLGKLKGNHFTIIIREVEKREIHNQDIENYYDEQRFSSKNVQIGKYLIKKELKQACKMLQETTVQEFLAKKPNDYLGAIKTLHKKQILLYMHAYQSYLFNEALKAYVQEKTKDIKEIPYSQGTFVFAQTEIETTELPLPTFDMPECKYYEKVFTQEDITTQDFITRHLPDAIQESTTRKTHMRPENFSITWIDNTTAQLKFFLPPGSYATIVCKKLFKEQNIF